MRCTFDLCDLCHDLGLTSMSSSSAWKLVEHFLNLFIAVSNSYPHIVLYPVLTFLAVYYVLSLSLLFVAVNYMLFILRGEPCFPHQCHIPLMFSSKRKMIKQHWTALFWRPFMHALLGHICKLEYLISDFFFK